MIPVSSALPGVSSPTHSIPPLGDMGGRTVTTKEKGCFNECWDKICAFFAYLRDLICCRPTAGKPLPPVKPLSPFPQNQTNLPPPSQPAIDPPSSAPISEPAPSPSPSPSPIDLSIPLSPQQPPQLVPPPSSTTPDIHPLRKQACDFIETNDIGEEGYDYSDLEIGDITDEFRQKTRLLKMYILSELTASDRPSVPQEVISTYVEIVLEDPCLNPQIKQTLKKQINERTALHVTIEQIILHLLSRVPLPQPLIQPRIIGTVCVGWAEDIIKKYTANSEEFDYEYASLSLDPLEDFRDYTQVQKVEFLLTLTSKDRSSHLGHDTVLNDFLMNFHPDKDISAQICADCMGMQNQPQQLHKYLAALLPHLRAVEKINDARKEAEKATSGIKDGDY